MNNLPPYVTAWVVLRTKERHFLCKLCSGPSGDHGNEEAFQRHLSSWGHKIRIREMEAIHCKACNLQCKYPSQYKTHIKSKSHNQKMNPEPKSELRCEACNVSFQCRAIEQTHLKTAKHLRNTNPSKAIVPNLFCETCNLQCKYPKQYEVHLTTSKHAKNVAKTDSSTPTQQDTPQQTKCHAT